MPRRAQRTTGNGREIASGLLLAVPVVVICAALLASADGVFASFLELPFDASVFRHVVWVAVGACLAVGVVCHSRAARPDEPVVGGTAPGTIEMTIVVGGLALVFALFAAAQSVAFFRDEDFVQRTTNLTYADYARSGFFQLLAVAALSAAILLTVVPATRRAEGRARLRLVVLSELSVALTLVIVAVALVRLDLYRSSYGLTMLRLVCTWVAWWLGVAFLVIGAAILGVGRRHRWITAALVALALVAVAIANVANPAEIVARANIERVQAEQYDDYGGASFSSSGRSFRPDRGLDVDYLVALGDDAAPVLLDHLDDMDPEVRAYVLDTVCRERPPDAVCSTPTSRPTPPQMPGQPSAPNGSDLSALATVARL